MITHGDIYFQTFDAYQVGLLSEEEWYEFTSQILVDLLTNQSTF